MFKSKWNVMMKKEGKMLMMMYFLAV